MLFRFEYQHSSKHVDEIPATFQGGIAYSIPKKLNLVYDLEHNEHQDRQHIGAEFWIYESLAIMAGFSEEYSVGASIKIGWIGFDYTFSPDAKIDEGALHSIGLVLTF